MEITLDLKALLELHLKWLRGEPGGKCANLENANLRSANLWGANQTISGRFHSGAVRGYFYIIAETKLGIHLQFGCESHLLADWDFKEISAKHEPGRGFPATLKALVALFKTTLD